MRFPRIHAIRFRTSDMETDGRKARFLGEFESFADHLIDVPLDRSIAYAENFAKLDALFSAKALEVGRPLRVLCDITCIPKTYILFLFGLGFEKGYFARFDCLYSEGNYSAVDRSASQELSVQVEHGPISEGKWDSLSVPFFEAGAPIPRSRDLLVTLGGELGLTVPFIEK